MKPLKPLKPIVTRISDSIDFTDNRNKTCSITQDNRYLGKTYTVIIPDQVIAITLADLLMAYTKTGEKVPTRIYQSDDVILTVNILNQIGFSIFQESKKLGLQTTILDFNQTESAMIAQRLRHWDRSI